MRYGLTREDYSRIIDTVPVITKLVPARQFEAEARVGEKTLDLQVIGTTAAWQDVNPVKVVSGRFLRQADDRDYNNVGVLTKSAAARLFPDEDPVGRNVRIGRQYYLICGVVEEVKAPAKTTPGFFIPLRTMRVRHGDAVLVRKRGQAELHRYELSTLFIEIDRGFPRSEASATLRSLLKRFHKADDFTISK